MLFWGFWAFRAWEIESHLTVRKIGEDRPRSGRFFLGKSDKIFIFENQFSGNPCFLLFCVKNTGIDLNLLPSDSRRFSIYRLDCYRTVIGFQFTCYRTVDEFQFTCHRTVDEFQFTCRTVNEFQFTCHRTVDGFQFLPAIGRSTNFNLLALSFNFGIGRSTNFNLLAY